MREPVSAGVWHPALQCSVLGLWYDFGTRVGSLALAPLSCTDMTAAIDLFTTIDPAVWRIDTVGRPAEYSTTYVRTAAGWEARRA
jgi:hypothetical protein